MSRSITCTRRRKLRQCQGVPTAYKLSLNQRDKNYALLKILKRKIYATIIQLKHLNIVQFTFKSLNALAYVDASFTIFFKITHDFVTKTLIILRIGITSRRWDYIRWNP